MQLQTLPAPARPAAKREKREKKPLHWLVKELFELATAAQLNDGQLEERILKRTGIRIPKNTLRYWKNGWSEPKIGEVEAIAITLDHEVELLQAS